MDGVADIQQTFSTWAGPNCEVISSNANSNPNQLQSAPQFWMVLPVKLCKSLSLIFNMLQTPSLQVTFKNMDHSSRLSSVSPTYPGFRLRPRQVAVLDAAVAFGRRGAQRVLSLQGNSVLGDHIGEDNLHGSWMIMVKMMIN